MFELIREYTETLTTSAATYRARAYAGVEENGVWGGYVVFVPVGGGRVISTERETTQTTLEALARWAETVSWVYLEGALARAIERQPEHQLERRLAEIEQIEAAALVEADELERAAEIARAEAAAAEKERAETERSIAVTSAAAASTSAALHERMAAEAREEAAAASAARIASEHAMAAAEEAAASRVADQHEKAAGRARASAAHATRRTGTKRKRTPR